MLPMFIFFSILHIFNKPGYWNDFDKNHFTHRVIQFFNACTFNNSLIFLNGNGAR